MGIGLGEWKKEEDERDGRTTGMENGTYNGNGNI
jgi:hypothetical protein